MRARSCKGAHGPPESLLRGVRWEVASPWRARPVAAGLEERGVPVEHAPLQRWVVTDSPQLEAAFHRRPRPVWGSGRQDEPSSKRNGQWEYRDGAGDTPGQRIACLWTAHRDEQAVKQGGTTAIRHQGVPEKSTSDGSAAHEAASTSSNTAHGTAIALRQPGPTVTPASALKLGVMLPQIG